MFSSFQSAGKGTEEAVSRQGAQSGDHLPFVVNTGLVFNYAEHAGGHTSYTTKEQGPTASPSQTRPSASHASKTTTTRLPSVRRAFINQGISSEVADMLMASWTPGTQTQYRTYIERWDQFCLSGQIDPVSPPISKVLDFLMHLYKVQGLRYSAINTARCALSTVVYPINAVTVGSHRLVKRFMKAVWSKRPTLARYSHTWDTSVVITYLKSMPALPYLTLRQLSGKLVTLLALISGHRAQSLHRLNIRKDLVEISDDGNFNETYVFKFIQPLKHNRVGRTVEPLVFSNFVSDPTLCAKSLLDEYIRRTAPLRGSATQLFISYRKPHKPVATCTISRWVREILSASGINTDIFKSHSTRSASSSKAIKYMSVADVLKAGQWSANSTSFCRHYRRDIAPTMPYDRVILTK